MGKSYCGTIDNRKKDKKQCDIHVVSESFYCDEANEGAIKCEEQCDYCIALDR